MRNCYIIGRRRSADSISLFFGKVEDVKKGIVYGVLEKNSHVKTLRSGFEIPLKDVVVDLGPNPHPGKVHGHDVSLRFRGKKTHDFFGSICFLYSPAKSVAQKLWRALDDAASLLKKHGLPPPENTVWEVHSSEVKAKWAGYYKHSRNAEKDPHRLAIRPESVPQTVGDLVYVVMHEYAHYLHAHHMTGQKLNAKWIRLFNTSIKVQKIERETIQRLLKDLISGEERPTDFKTQLEEDDRNAFNWILRAIKADHSVSVSELDMLFAADYRDDIEGLWPKVALNKKDLKPVVSEYATVNYKELFAESFAFFFTKRKLPEGVIKLLEQSLSFAKANQERS